MDALISALDMFLEAAGRAAKARAVGPIQDRLEAAMGKMFRAQGRIFGARFERAEAWWPAAGGGTEAMRTLLGELGGGGGGAGGVRAVLEKLMGGGVEEGDWDGMFEAAEEGTFDVFLGPMQQAAKAGLVSGAQARIAGVGGDYLFN